MKPVLKHASLMLIAACIAVPAAADTVLRKPSVAATPIEIPKQNIIGATPIEIPKEGGVMATPIEIPGQGGIMATPIEIPGQGLTTRTEEDDD